MQCFVFAIFCLAVSAAMPLDIVDNGNGDSGDPLDRLPLSPEMKHRLKLEMSNAGFGGSYKKNLFENDSHRFDGTASAGKTYGSNGLLPNQFGGGVEYTNKDSGLSAFGAAENTRGFGTDVNAGLKYNIHEGKNYGVDVSGQYSRHYGGAGGTGPPNGAVFVNAHADI